VADAYSAGNPNSCADLAAAVPNQALIGLLRLQAMVLANPQPLAGLRAMVDMMFTSPRTTLVGVGEPIGDEGMVRYLAHAGRAEPAHQTLVMEATPIAAKAMGTGELVQVTHTKGVPHVCVHVPIIGTKQVMGFFGIGIRGKVPIEQWREEIIWAASDLMALLLLRHQERRDSAAAGGSPLDALTPRQRDALYNLVEYGSSNSEIGLRLGLSARTIKIHLMAAYRQLGVRTRADAIRMVLTKHDSWLERERASWRERTLAI
jgi:DNA-binding CsgD family transcriptional regulator